MDVLFHNLLLMYNYPSSAFGVHVQMDFFIFFLLHSIPLHNLFVLIYVWIGTYISAQWRSPRANRGCILLYDFIISYIKHFINGSHAVRMAAKLKWWYVVARIKCFYTLVCAPHNKKYSFVFFFVFFYFCILLR